MINSTSHGMSKDQAYGTFAEVYEKLLPVLVQCFAIIGLGYVSGRTRLIPQSETRGLQSVVTYFFLPALVFRSLATIDFKSVNYKFLGAIFIGKLIIFVSVIAITWLLKRKNRTGFAGLMGVFCTQSNDFALGYPLVSFLYDKDHPEFAHYLYLIAPIQLMIMNPLGFILMEYGRIIDDQRPRQCQPSSFSHFKRTIWGVLKNPIIGMTGLGIVANFCFQQKLPTIVETIMAPMSNAFSACALFLLGLNMVDGFSKMCKYTFLTTTLIVCVKVLASPIVLREVITHIGISDDAFTDFGFLYGMIPPAPTVAIFASQFCLPNEAVTAGVVVGTFVSAPLIFITATMSRIHDSPSYKDTLTDTISYTSLVTIPFCLWTLFVLLPKRKRITHSTTMWLLGAQTVTCIGGVMLFFAKGEDTLSYYAHVLVSLAGVFASRIWTAVIALVLMLGNQRSLCFVLKIRGSLIYGGLAAALIGTIILLAGTPIGSHRSTPDDPNFHLGRAQAGVAFAFLVISSVITLYALVKHLRMRARDEYESLIVPNDGEEGTSNDLDFPSTTRAVAIAPSCASCSCSNNRKLSMSIPDLEDIGKPKFVKRQTPRVRRLSEKRTEPSQSTSTDPVFCGPSHNCKVSERKLCITTVKEYLHEIHPGTEMTEPEVDLHQNFRHVCLLIMLLFSMLIGIAVSLWQLLIEKPTGILLEIEFLDVVLNYGQGLLTFIVFGADASWMFFPYREILKFFFRCEVQLPAFCELPEEVKHRCEQFRTFHMELFVNDVCPDMDLEDVKFSGQQMCDWICLVGLVQTRDEAVYYGRALLEGRVIAHLTNMKHFEDNINLYRFMDSPLCALIEAKPLDMV